MGFITAISDHWFSLLQTAGIIGGLVFTAASMRAEAEARRTANLLTLTEQHRRIWSELFDRPELHRVFEVRLCSQEPRATDAEALFIRLLILHLNSAFRAIGSGVLFRPEALRFDVGWFFSLPLPKQVWDAWAEFQDTEFAAFVTDCLREYQAGSGTSAAHHAR